MGQSRQPSGSARSTGVEESWHQSFFFLFLALTETLLHASDKLILVDLDPGQIHAATNWARKGGAVSGVRGGTQAAAARRRALAWARDATHMEQRPLPQSVSLSVC